MHLIFFCSGGWRLESLNPQVFACGPWWHERHDASCVWNMSTGRRTMAQTTHGQSWPGAVLSKFSAASLPVQTIPEVQSGLLSLFKLDHTLSSTQEQSLRSVPEQLICVPFIYYGTTSHLKEMDTSTSISSLLFGKILENFQHRQLYDHHVQHHLKVLL